MQNTQTLTVCGAHLSFVKSLSLKTRPPTNDRLSVHGQRHSVGGFVRGGFILSFRFRLRVSFFPSFLSLLLLWQSTGESLRLPSMLSQSVPFGKNLSASEARTITSHGMHIRRTQTEHVPYHLLSMHSFTCSLAFENRPTVVCGTGGTVK